MKCVTLLRRHGGIGRAHVRVIVRSLALGDGTLEKRFLHPR